MSALMKLNLRPNSDYLMKKQHDEISGYEELLTFSREKYDGEIDENDSNTLQKQHFEVLKKHFNEENLIFTQSNFENIFQNNLNDLTLEILEKLIDPQLEKKITSYFKSHFYVLWSSLGKVENKDNVSARWHCDGGPSTHLKTITYLNPSSEHNSHTLVMEKALTDPLKKIGYVFCNVNERLEDISDFCHKNDLEYNPHKISYEAGDTFLFNPFEVIHRADLPDSGKQRLCINLCFIPSPLPWRECINYGLKPAMKCVPFESIPSNLKNLYQEKYSKKANTKINTQHAPQIKNEEPIMLINQSGTIQDEHSLQFYLEAMFKDKEIVNFIKKQFMQISGNHSIQIESFNQLMVMIKKSFKTTLNWDDFFRENDLNNIRDFLNFEEIYRNTLYAYQKEAKPNPDAVFWPIPNHPKHPKNKFEMKPFVKRFPILDKSTAIGTAGSCFAFEIAKAFQEHGYNYVVTERADDKSDGVIVDGYTPGDKYAKFSANYGILFNTPSLKQLAQKAFGEKQFKKFLVDAGNGYYTDPYRENVFFASPQAYLNDYDKHIEAIQQSLLQSEVFIFTAGLNECWELPDQTVISRNPRHGFHQLMKHRVLTVQENVDNIKAFYEIVKKWNPKLKLILSLSPIPLLATGRSETHHILEANTHSKAVLRVALDQVVAELEDVYYLPSYEYVNECSKDPWTEDHRHIKKEIVVEIVEMFKEMFEK
jgi:ectoine hydroxylase-related dioxygenase (phytanoyl-CoA dioxygenase family)